MDYNHTALDGQTYTCKVISLSTSSITVVHLNQQLNNGGAMIRAEAQEAINTKGARFLKKAEFEQVVLDGSINPDFYATYFCYEDCIGYYRNSKFVYQKTSVDPQTTAFFFLVFDL